MLDADRPRPENNLVGGRSTLPVAMASWDGSWTLLRDSLTIVPRPQGKERCLTACPH